MKRPFARYDDRRRSHRHEEASPALLAVAALAVVAVVVVENTPERRMDRKIHRLLRTYDEPKQLYQRVFDDRDLLGFVLVNSFARYKGSDRCGCDAITTSDTHEVDCDYRTYLTQHLELFVDFIRQFEAALCDCGKAPSPWVGFSFVVFSAHPADCNLTRAWQDIQKTWGPYMLRKREEFHEAWLNR